MTRSASVVLISPAEEARRFWQEAVAAFDSAGEDVTPLCEALDLGLRAAEILVTERLRPVRDRFPATIGLLLDSPGPEIDIQRDAVEPPRALGFTDILDLLSEDRLSCVAPELHRGWEDRVFSCRRSRATAREAAGIELGSEERQALLMLSAYRNRIFRQPPPVRLAPAEIRRCFPVLLSLIARLSE